MKILSLLPSATEIVCELGLEDSLVGVSGDCDFPTSVKNRPSLTTSEINSDRSSRAIDEAVKTKRHAGRSLYHLEEDRLRDLDPDLVLTQEQCDVCAPVFDRVESACRILEDEPIVLSLEAHSLDDVLNCIRAVGAVTDRENEASRVTERLIQCKRSILDEIDTETGRGRVLTLEWLDPPYVGGHWIPEMVRDLGYESYAEPGMPSEQVNRSSLYEYDPDVSILMPCGFALDRTLDEGREWIDLLDDPTGMLGSTIVAVDGDSYFSRPGPRLFDGLAILADILYPSQLKEVSIPDNSRESLA